MTATPSRAIDPQQLLLGTSSFTHALLTTTALSNRLSETGARLTQQQAQWFAGVSALHDIGALVNMRTDVAFAALANILMNRVQNQRIRAELREMLGESAIYLLRAIMSFEGVCLALDPDARLERQFGPAFFRFLEQIRELYPAMRPPSYMNHYPVQRILSGVVALARDLMDSSELHTRDRLAMRHEATARLRDLDLDTRILPWPATPRSTAALSSSLRIIEARFAKIVQALQYGFRLIAQGHIDNIIIACRTRARVLHVHDQLSETLQLPMVQGLPYDHGPTGWFTQNTQHYLLAPVCVTTREQVFKAVRLEAHAYFRTAALSRALLVLDDVYTSNLMDRVLCQVLIRNQLTLRGFVVVTSAVLDQSSRQDMLLERWVPPEPIPGHEMNDAHAATADSYTRAVETAFPRVWNAPRNGRLLPTIAVVGHPRNSVRVSMVADGSPAAVARQAVSFARKGKSVIVFRNTTADCRETAQEVEVAGGRDLLLSVNGLPVAYHGDYTPNDRHVINDAAVAAMGRGNKPYCRIIVTTCQMENGLHLEADVVISDFAPVDALLRRAERLNSSPQRRFFVVESPVGHRWVQDALTDSGAPRRMPFGLGTIYQDIFRLHRTYHALRQVPEFDLANPREFLEAAFHPSQDLAIEEGGPRWVAHRRWLEGRLARSEIAAETLRWTTYQQFGEQEADVHPDRAVGEPRPVYIEGPPEIVVNLGSAPSPLGPPMGALYVRFMGGLTNFERVFPDRWGTNGWRFNDVHTYDNYGYQCHGGATP